VRGLRWPQRIYILGVIGGAVVALALSATSAPLPQYDDLIAFVILLTMSTLAVLFPVHVSIKVKMTVDDLPNFAAAILLGPMWAMVVAAGAKLIGARYRKARVPWTTRAFNAAAATLAVGAGATAFQLLGKPDLPLLQQPLAVIVAAALMYTVQTELVDVVVALQLRRRLFNDWWQEHRRDLPNEAALFLLGALAAASAEQQPLALILFAVPMAITLITLRESAHLRAQTREAILELADIIDLRDPYTHGHSQRVAQYAERLARRLSMESTQIALIRDAARVHDIGKIGTNDMVLQKPGPLTTDEMAEMHKHSDIGHRLLKRLPEFWEGAELVLAHHERHDGNGYPRGLRGDELPMEVSVISVADTYDAMTTDRPYRKALPWPTVRAELVKNRDKQWRGGVVDAFVAMIEEQRAREAATEPAGTPVSLPTAERTA
jgi:HD-GYP domain-containing protein (c-di-GMP phosphodiesterase class II)